MLTHWHRRRTEIRHPHDGAAISVRHQRAEQRWSGAPTPSWSYFCLSCCLSSLDRQLFDGHDGIEKAPD